MHYLRCPSRCFIVMPRIRHTLFIQRGGGFAGGGSVGRETDAAGPASAVAYRPRDNDGTDGCRKLATMFRDICMYR